MMRVRNPHFADPVAAWASSRAAAFDAWLATQDDVREVSFDAIRDAFPGELDPVTGTAPLTDGSIAAALQVLGYEVIST